jgi:hypothetical protein
MRCRSATPISTIWLIAASALATSCSTYVSFGSAPPAREFFWDQFGAGARTGAIGTGLGALAGLGLAVASGEAAKDGWAAIGGLALGGVFGNVIAAPIGVSRFSRARGVGGSLVASYVGSAIGILGLAGGGVGFFFTVPAGATLGYNVRRD